VRRIVVLGAIAAALTGCGSSSTAHGPIVFGIAGGNVRPYRISIQPNGSVRGRGRTVLAQIRAARVRALRREIQQAHLSSRRCAGVLPDVASRYIRVGRRTITVHGSCESGFDRVWNDLAEALNLPL
jgi:hypothetical protein